MLPPNTDDLTLSTDPVTMWAVWSFSVSLGSALVFGIFALLP